MATLEQLAQALQIGTPGQVLGIAAGQTIEPVTVSGSGPSPSSSTPANIGAPAVGVSLDYARADHAHGGALADLSDVASTAPTSGQVLAWSGSEWAPATAPSGGPWQEAAGVISPTTPGSVAQVDVTFGAVGVAVTDTSAAFASRLQAGTISAVDTGGVIFAAISAVGEASLSLRGDTGGGVIPKIVATDFDTLPTALDLQILDLQINGAAGSAGDVLTSQGGGAAPTWAPAASGPWQVLGGIISPANTGDTVSIGDGSGNETGISAGAVTLFRMTPGDCVINAAPALDLQLADELKINGATSTAGDVLTSNGPGVPPTWQPAAGGGIAYIDHTINLTTTNSVGGQFAQDHQVSGLDASSAYLMDLAEFDNYSGGINQVGLLACTKAPASPTSTIAATEQQAAILGTFSAPASISSLPILDGTSGTVIGPRAGFSGSPVAPAVVTTDTAGALNLRGLTNVNGGGFRVKIRLRKVSP